MTPEQKLALMLEEAKWRYFRLWYLDDEGNKTAKTSRYFNDFVWEKQLYARLWKLAFMSGANALMDMNKKSEAELQCLEHHFCLERESSDYKATIAA